MFGFQRLDVYRSAVRFLALSPRLCEKLNIAEGSGKGGRDAARYYTIARGSALECTAVLDAAEALGLTATEDLVEPRELLERIVAMLTKLRAAA